jgi:hypothetical protein
LAHTARLLETRRTDQRIHRRYPITLEIEYRLLNKGRIERVGIGRTLNISSGGVLFETDDSFPAGASIELMMNWPFLLEGVCPLKLAVRGRVVRSDSHRIAIRTKHHEFRTAGARSARIPQSGDKVRSLMT